jgi:hypothetical protein
MSIEQNIVDLLRCHPEERRAKRVKLENYALTLERMASTGEEQWASMQDAAARLRVLASEVYPI